MSATAPASTSAPAPASSSAAASAVRLVSFGEAGTGSGAALQRLHDMFRAGILGILFACDVCVRVFWGMFAHALLFLFVCLFVVCYVRRQTNSSIPSRDGTSFALFCLRLLRPLICAFPFPLPLFHFSLLSSLSLLSASQFQYVSVLFFPSLPPLFSSHLSCPYSSFTDSQLTSEASYVEASIKDDLSAIPAVYQTPITDPTTQTARKGDFFLALAEDSKEKDGVGSLPFLPL
jgi:hypothetical protein